jgi:chromosome partitioning protein
MHVYAVSLEKGGVGKTSVAVNLAVALRQVGLTPLLIDMDAQAHASQWLGIADVRAEETLLGLLQGRTLPACVRQTAEGVDVVPAHPAMVGLPALLVGLPNNGIFALRTALAQAKQAGAPYDVVVLDLAPARGPVQVAALAAATRCIAPVQAEDLVLQSLKALIDSVEQAQQINPHLKGLSILRNRYTIRGTIDQAYDAALRDEYAPFLLTTTIPVRAALRHAAGVQQSVFRYASADASEVRALFVELVDELLRLDGVA